MNDEEYLRACGWKRFGPAWIHDRHRWDAAPGGEVRHRLAEAVEAQLAEDRARLAFVLHRTSPLVAAERGETAAVAALGAIMEEHRPGGDALTVTTPEDARRLFGEPMYEPGGAPSNAAAAAIEALKTQRPVMAVKIR